MNRAFSGPLAAYTSGIVGVRTAYRARMSRMSRVFAGLEKGSGMRGPHLPPAPRPYERAPKRSSRGRNLEFRSRSIRRWPLFFPRFGISEEGVSKQYLSFGITECRYSRYSLRDLDTRHFLACIH